MRNYKWVCLLFFGLVLFINIGCKEDGDGKLLSGLSGDVDSSTGGSGCRGRNSGVKSATLSPIYLPFANGTQHVLGQGWFGTFSHDTTGREHALDFSMVDGVTDIYAVKSGIVMAVKEDSNTTCSSNCPYANYVEIDHGSGFYARYLHFAYNSINVNVGDVINSSTYILGKAGNTGWSTGPHLHIEVVDFEENCTAEYTFNDVGSAGNLNTGTAYTSGYNTPGSAPILSQLKDNVFLNSGIALTAGFDWKHTGGSSFTISGNVDDGKPQLKIFVLLESLNGDKLAGSEQTYDASPDSSFTNISYTVPSSSGSYYIGISSSQNGSWSYNNPPRFVIQ